MNATTPIQVLLVEDNPGDVRLVREALIVTRRRQLSLTHVESVREALDYMASHDVGVVLLDLSLPDGYGLETFTKIHSAMPDIPILVYTSLDDEEVALRAMREGAQDYLVKGLLDTMSPERAILYAIERQRIEMENRRLNAELEQRVIDRTAELEILKQRLESILNHSPDPIFLLNRQVGIQAANPVFSQLFGYREAELPDLSLSGLVAPEYVDMVRHALHEVIFKRIVQRLEVVARDKDGRVFDASIALSPIQDQYGVSSVVCIVRDISGLKEIERLKDNFVSNVSHELRTPITSMKLNIALLSKTGQDTDELIGRIQRECNRLTRIIEDLLTLSRLEQNQVPLKLTWCNLTDVAQEYVGDRVPLAESHQLHLSLEQDPDLPLLEADRGLIGMALSVLLTNAFNYTPPGGLVEVRTRNRQAGGTGWAGISVRDNGPGISPAEQSQLFVRFFRGEAARQSRQPGTGLGLSIVKQILDRHHGQVEVESEGIPGKGTAFTLWLPLAEEDRS